MLRCTTSSELFLKSSLTTVAPEGRNQLAISIAASRYPPGFPRKSRTSLFEPERTNCRRLVLNRSAETAEKLNKKVTDDYNNNVPKNENNSGESKAKPVNNATEFSNSGGEENGDDSKTNQTPQTSQQEQEKSKTEFQNDINKAQNGTDDDKVKAIKNSGRIFGEESFEKQKAQIAALEEDLAINNPPKYFEAIIGKIEENLKKNKLSIEELDAEIQQDNKDNKINEHISKKGVQKRIKKLTEKVKKISKLSKEKIKKLRSKVLRIINSSNKYDQEYKAEAQQLLVQLDTYQVKNPNSNNNFPKGLVISGGIVLTVGIILVLMIRRYKKRKN